MLYISFLLFSTKFFQDKKTQMNWAEIWQTKENQTRNPLNAANSVVFSVYLQARFFTKHFTGGNYPSGHFSRTGTMPSADDQSAMPSRDQFKPIKIRENLVVNY